MNWPDNYQDVTLIRPDSSLCAVFRRESGRLIWGPKRLIQNVKPVANIIKQIWHNILGNPGHEAQ